MKKNYVKIMFCLAIFSVLSFESFAQNNPQLTESFEIRLNQNDIQKDKITFGIKSLKFKSELQANRFFEAISDNLIFYKLNYQTKTVFIELQKSNIKESWRVSEWNKYVATNRERYLSYYKRILIEK